MDSFELNKIAGALLLAMLVFIGLREISHVVYHKAKPEKPGYVVALADGAEKGQTTDKKPAAKPGDDVDMGALLLTASLENGKKILKKCVACHVFEKGGPNKVGPGMWDIVGRAVASLEGFSYSNALKEYGGKWTYETLDCFLTKPKKCVKGTKMVFAGLKKPKDRADLILYLRSLSDAPVPLPKKSAKADG
ncbi:MAG: cytochrome c family protein [Pseudomonadota bacterium]